MSRQQMLCRLAIRTISTGATSADVVFHLAQPHTMEDAIELARFPKAVLDNAPGLFDKILKAFEEALNQFIVDETGIHPTGWRTTEPIEPREGQA